MSNKNTDRDKLELIVLDSLVKVFADERPGSYGRLNDASMLLNEVFSFQVAFCWNDFLLRNASVEIISELAPSAMIYSVGLVPSELPCYPDHDDDLLRTAPGLYPDPLYLIGSSGKGTTDLLPAQWRSVWFEIHAAEHIVPGIKNIEIRFTAPDGEILGSTAFRLMMISGKLPEQELIYTNWIHTDCISSLHQVEIFSERYWELISRYISEASAHGMNMLLTPVFTPPLDTAIGGERPTVQLVDVTVTGSGYVFGFEKLEKWFRLAGTCGIKYFEISHLFTQWGAEHVPKIIGTKEGVQKKLFGWDTDAAGEEYKGFLRDFLPALTGFIRSKGLEERCFFHVSDEPSFEQIGSYSAASGIVREFLDGSPVIDALSDIDFYNKGIIPRPVAATDHIGSFLEAEIDGLWAYYCCGQYKGVSNRFFCMPSCRNRVLGLQLYKFGIEGFLHWGYNFWYSQYSVSTIDPYKVTDSGHAFPSGDPFIVYPGENGPVPSLRLKVFREALQDMRAAKLLESLAGRKKVLELIDKGFEGGITFSRYPKDPSWLLSVRERINRAISEITSTFPNL